MKIQINLPFHEDKYTVSTDCDEILLALQQNFGIYCTEFHGEAEYMIERVEESYIVHYADRCYEADDPIQFLHNRMFTNKKIKQGFFAFHAGAAAHHGKAYIFCAATTTGKTTLTAYLTERGLDYISDDCVFVDQSSLAVYPCHTPIHLRGGGYDVLRRLGAEPKSAVKVHDRFVYTPERLSSESLEIGGIYFMERTSDENSVSGLTGGDALRRLMLSPITVYPMCREYITFLHRLTPYCRSLRYCDMGYVAEIIMKGNGDNASTDIQ